MTLNQTVSRLKKLAELHKQVNHFYFGNMIEWLSNGDVVYPAIFTDLPTGEISGNEKQTFFDFEIWFCDLCNVAERSRENELELQSDLTSIAMDYKAMLEFTDYNSDWTISKNSPIAYYEEKFNEDLVVSVKMNVRIGILNNKGRCDLPTDFAYESERETEDSELRLLENSENLNVS